MSVNPLYISTIAHSAYQVIWCWWNIATWVVSWKMHIWSNFTYIIVINRFCSIHTDCPIVWWRTATRALWFVRVDKEVLWAPWTPWLAIESRFNIFKWLKQCTTISFGLRARYISSWSSHIVHAVLRLWLLVMMALLELLHWPLCQFDRNVDMGNDDPGPGGVLGQVLQRPQQGGFSATSPVLPANLLAAVLKPCCALSGVCPLPALSIPDWLFLGPGTVSVVSCSSELFGSMEYCSSS